LGTTGLELSGDALHVVDGLDIVGQHGCLFRLLLHTHRPPRRPCPIYTNRIV